MGLESVETVGQQAIVIKFKEVVMGSGLTVVALSTDDTARPNGPDSVTRCSAGGDSSVVGLCQLWVLGLSVAAARLVVFVSLGWRKASLAQMWVVGLCASIRIANGLVSQVSRSIVWTMLLAAMMGTAAARK